MRPIKFRVWLDEFNKMFYDVGLMDGELYVNIDGKGYDVVGDCRDSKLMQFTGLYDKNMKQIYEGDIVRWKHKDATEHEYIISVVKWFGDEGYPAFDLEPNDGADCNALSLIFQSREYEIEVIGNIYENPEWLEAEGNEHIPNQN